ncbi:DUF6193 family natural product biosynthesis protein [Streptomyces sp. NPDC093595]|uniref:DUF6193 family natural product biosynthesis protein n=1 Tax=Streptomyces sp. NPDC093595 TaxID=3366045 RepID=UPI00380A0E61
MASGSTHDLHEVAGALHSWLHGPRVRDLVAQWPFLRTWELAEAHERGDAVAVRWRRLRETASRRPDTGLYALVEAAFEQKRLRVLSPGAKHALAHLQPPRRPSATTCRQPCRSGTAGIGCGSPTADCGKSRVRQRPSRSFSETCPTTQSRGPEARSLRAGNRSEQRRRAAEARKASPSGVNQPRIGSRWVLGALTGPRSVPPVSGRRRHPARIASTHMPSGWSTLTVWGLGKRSRFGCTAVSRAARTAGWRRTGW